MIEHTTPEEAATTEKIGIECLGIGTFNNGKKYWVVRANGEIVRLKISDFKPSKLLALAPLEAWRSAFPDFERQAQGMADPPLSWQKAHSWIFHTCQKIGPYTVPEREIEIGQRRNMEIGEYLRVTKMMWPHEREIFECMKEGVDRYSRDLAPKFDYQIGENEVIVKRIG